MKKLTTLFMSLLVGGASFSQVVINEIQASNTNTIEDPEYQENADWIELYNASDQEVDLSGYAMSDNSTNTDEWIFPAGTTIDAKGYLIVWADGKSESGLHADFSISNNGDEVVLFSPEAEIVDAINFGESEDDVSIGRTIDGGNVWGVFATPTPGTQNSGTAVRMQAPEVIFGLKEGYYGDAQTVSLTSFIPDGVVYYTTDGSTPTQNSTEYSAPITISKNTVLKAISYHERYLVSRIHTKTYFIGERKSTLPVISLGVDPVEFFDEETGMYMSGPDASPYDPNYGANFWEERELPVSFEYFEDGKQEVDVNAGIKIFGGWSRRFDQKSFSINCRDEYGDERMRYKFFPDKDINVFKQVLLRNSGSNVDELKYRDLMLQSLVKGQMDVDYQDGVPTVVYINGEYWGILNLREKVNERYLKDNYGYDQDDVDLLANYQGIGDELHGSAEDFWGMFEYVSFEDFEGPAMYGELSSMIDVDEFINYQLTQIYVGNHDWPADNIKYWKNNDLDTEWRWILYDLDQSFAYYDYCTYDVNTLYDATHEVHEPHYWASHYNGILFLSKFLENETFRTKFITQLCAHMSSTFSTDRIKNRIEYYENLLYDEKPYHIERWSPVKKDSVWNKQHDQMIEFAEERPAKMREFMEDQFNLSSASLISVTAKNNRFPRYKVCGVPTAGQDYTGYFYDDLVVKIEALPSPNYKFVHWEDADNNVVSSNETIKITVDGDQALFAVYEEVTKIEGLYINEFMASNNNSLLDSRGESDDWIEIYNDNDFAIDLAGLYLCDDFTSMNKVKIEGDGSDKTVVPAKGYIILWADSDENQGPTHIDLKLSANGEQLAIIQGGTEDHWIDSLTFPAQQTDVSYGRVSDGSASWKIFDAATPNASNDGTVGIMPNKLDGVKIYPTLVDDYVTVNNISGADCQVSIINTTGKLMLKSALSRSEKKISVDKLPAGLYLVKVYNQAGVFVEKIYIK